MERNEVLQLSQAIPNFAKPIFFTFFDTVENYLSNDIYFIYIKIILVTYYVFPKYHVVLIKALNFASSYL